MQPFFYQSGQGHSLCLMLTFTLTIWSRNVVQYSHSVITMTIWPPFDSCIRIFVLQSSIDDLIPCKFFWSFLSQYTLMQCHISPSMVDQPSLLTFLTTTRLIILSNFLIVITIALFFTIHTYCQVQVQHLSHHYPAQQSPSFHNYYLAISLTNHKQINHHNLLAILCIVSNNLIHFSNLNNLSSWQSSFITITQHYQ